MYDTDEHTAGEVGALGRLGLTELAAAVGGIGRIHSSISGNIFRVLDVAVGRRARTARILHDTISGSVYTAIAEILGVAADVAEVLPEPERRPSDTRRGAALVGILNGLIGDELADRGSPLAGSMSIRSDGAVVSLSPSAIHDAFPDATGHLVVFVHGLMETEHAWAVGGRPTYGARLRADIRATPVDVRYNTGRHISDNGRDLCDLLSELVGRWPVPPTRITLVGHSMGGLVIRSACDHAMTDGSRWLPLLTDTVSLGTPHLGAPLARGVGIATTILGGTQMTSPVGDLLRRRSAGVRDLVQGRIRAEDWSDADPDAMSEPRIVDVALLPWVRHLIVTATITSNPDHPVGKLIGDGLVRAASGRGTGRDRVLGFRPWDTMHLGAAHHFTLLNDDEIYMWLRTNLAPRALPA
ncbi:permease [Gordonia sinesedis]